MKLNGWNIEKEVEVAEGVAYILSKGSKFMVLNCDEDDNILDREVVETFEEAEELVEELMW